MGRFRPVKAHIAAAALALLLTAAAFFALAIEGGDMLQAALDGRRARPHAHTHLAEFELRAQMYSAQADMRVNGWLSVAEQREVALDRDGVTLAAWLYEPIAGAQDAPWALLLHGGQGSSHTQLMDVACALSLEGYRVLAPDLRAHGASGGRLTSLGLCESRDVSAWAAWILERDADARIVIYGHDEGAAAALLAADLPQAVRAIAADSVYASVGSRAVQMAQEACGRWSGLRERLFALAYRAAFGEALAAGDMRQPGRERELLLIHGTADEDVPAWHSEEIAQAAGGRAQLMLIEGAAHGMARFLEPDAYYEALLAFYDRALE